MCRQLTIEERDSQRKLELDLLGRSLEETRQPSVIY
jgi:hypothetical protein